MIKYLLLCLLATSQGIHARPAAHSSPADLASHILIVTPQAEVHLEPALKYEAVVPNTFIQHLSPLARYAAPHDETIIYVPSGAAVNAVARSAPSVVEQVRRQDAKQYEQISQQIEQIQGAIQQGSSAVGPQLSEAASAAASAASNAGTGFFPALFPPAASGSSKKEDKPKADKIEYEAIPTVAASPLLSAAGESRRFYALTPAVSHVIDVYVGPLSAIRARSIQESEIEQETKKLTEGTADKDTFKLEPLASEFQEKTATETAFKETLKIEADSLKEERGGEQRPESREDKFDEKLADSIKLEEKPVENKNFDDKKFEEKIIEEKKLPEAKLETDKFDEKKNFEEKKAEFEEKKFEEKKLTEKKFEEKSFEVAPQQQQLQQQQQQQQQIIIEEKNQQLLDRLPSADSAELEKPQLPLQDLKEQLTQERKELPIAEQPIQERKEEAAELQLKEFAEKEQPQQKLYLETPQQHQQHHQQDQQAEPLQQQKQLLNQEQAIEEKKEFKEKRKEIELKKEDQFQLEQQQLLQESFKKNNAELNKAASETEKEQQSAAQPQPQLQLQPQLQPQRAASGRVDGYEAVPVQHAAPNVDEPHQQQKSVAVAPADPVPVVPHLVPQQAKIV